jgi:hypothetical protein
MDVECGWGLIEKEVHVRRPRRPATAAGRIGVLARNAPRRGGSRSGATVATMKAIAARLDISITDAKTGPPDSDKVVDLADDPAFGCATAS